MATVKLDPAKGVQIPNLSTTERNAISSPETGALIWNSTTSKINQYNGSAWQDITIAGISSSADATAITINSSEQVGIGKTPVNTLDVNHSGGAIVKLWRDSSSGYLQFDTDGTSAHIKNGGGSIKFKTGGDTVRASVTDNGICFGTDTAAANALDDYEEGSWNPQFQGSSGSAGSVNYGEYEGYYTRIGRLVTVQFKITLSNKGSWGGEVRLTGLPYSVQVTLPGAGSCQLGYVNYAGGSVGNVSIYVTAGVTYFRPRYTHDNDAPAMVQVSECQNTARFEGMFSYITVGA